MSKWKAKKQCLMSAYNVQSVGTSLVFFALNQTFIIWLVIVWIIWSVMCKESELRGAWKIVPKKILPSVSFWGRGPWPTLLFTLHYLPIWRLIFEKIWGVGETVFPPLGITVIWSKFSKTSDILCRSHEFLLEFDSELEIKRKWN